MPTVRPWVLDTPHSGIRRMLEHAREVDSPVMLANGDPNFVTPAHIIDAAAAAAHAGGTGYSPGDGLVALREAVADKLGHVNGIDVGYERVCITTGACGGLYTTLMVLLDPGDELLIPDPGWSNYAAMVHVLNATPVAYPLRPEAGWSLDADAIEASITPRTRGILLNSPSNPTGSVESAQTLRRVLQIAARHDLWVISDEAYDQLTFDGPGTSIASLGGDDRVISIFAFSKTYAMTGWRVGYVTGPSAFTRQVSLHQEPVVSCASTVSQHAALAALAGPQDCVTEMVDAYRRRRDLAARLLADGDVPFVLPHGAFFLMVDIRATGLDSWTCALALLREHGVGTVPGLAFGSAGEGFLRITLAAADEQIAAGLGRLVPAYAQLTSAAAHA
ncbi:MAG: aminotransferase class I/II-fold pyridoxal phosphate-dependent enzyme [Actinomycetales bacterium]|nr:aminotransferase class I/II-fold pyridoxal phosphate-dependent enzyme [Actinomycetales bacterium]